MDALTDSSPSDSMVEIARIISPSEALTLRAMFEAADIVCHIGGWWHHSVQLCGLGLGGFRLSVSRIHHEPASVLIREYLAQPVGAAPFYAQRRRVVRLLGILAITIVVPSMVTMRAGDNLAPWWAYIVAPMTLLGTPVPAQGSGDYYLAAKPVA